MKSSTLLAIFCLLFSLYSFSVIEMNKNKDGTWVRYEDIEKGMAAEKTFKNGKWQYSANNTSISPGGDFWMEALDYPESRFNSLKNQYDEQEKNNQKQ